MAPSLEEEVKIEHRSNPLVLLDQKIPLSTEIAVQSVEAPSTATEVVSVQSTRFVLEDHPIDVKPKLKVH
jgi:hypothetical protein